MSKIILFSGDLNYSRIMGKLIVDKITRNVYCVSTSLVDKNNINSSTTFTNYSCVDTTTNINQGGFTVASTGILVPVPGLYLICFNCYYYSTGVRENVKVGVTIKSNLTATYHHGYIRDADSHQNSSVAGTQIAYLQPDQLVGLEFAREANSGTVNLVGANSHFGLAKID